MPTLAGARAGVPTRDKDVYASGGEVEKILMLEPHLALRAAHEGLAQAKADRELAHAGVRLKVGEDLVEGPVQRDELERAASVDPHPGALRHAARPARVERLLALRDG